MDYELDLNPGHIVDWLRDDRRSGHWKHLQISATREYGAEAVADPEDAGIGEDQDMSVLTTTGTLEISPAATHDRWVLRVQVTDDLGAHLPEDESVPEDAEEIDLEALQRDFIAADTGTVSVSVSCETRAAKDDFDRLLSEILTDRHSG